VQAPRERHTWARFAGLAAAVRAWAGEGTGAEAGSHSTADILEKDLLHSLLILLRPVRIFRPTVIRDVEAQLIVGSAREILRDVV
jgi:hypothetical protein